MSVTTPRYWLKRAVKLRGFIFQPLYYSYFLLYPLFDFFIGDLEKMLVSILLAIATGVLCVLLYKSIMDGKSKQYRIKILQQTNKDLFDKIIELEGV